MFPKGQKRVKMINLPVRNRGFHVKGFLINKKPGR